MRHDARLRTTHVLGSLTTDNRIRTSRPLIEAGFKKDAGETIAWELDQHQPCFPAPRWKNKQLLLEKLSVTYCPQERASLWKKGEELRI